MMNSRKGLRGQIALAKGTLDASCYSGKLLATVDSDGLVGLCFSRPRHTKFLNIANPGVSFEDALAALLDVKPHNTRCADCTCMAPIEFSLCNFLNMDTILDNYRSENFFGKLEKAYVKRIKLIQSGTSH
jgi:hypothetical protein